MCFVGSLARFGGYRGSTSVSTPRAPGWVTFFVTAARPRNIHLDRALGGCQHERNINGRAGRGPVSIFLTNRRESLHQHQSPAPWHSCSRGRCARTRGRLLGTQAARSPSPCFQLLTRSSHAIFSARIFLIVPKLHHNAPVPKLPFCKSLSPKMLVGGRGFEPRTSCAQGRRAAVIKT